MRTQEQRETKSHSSHPEREQQSGRRPSAQLARPDDLWNTWVDPFGLMRRLTSRPDPLTALWGGGRTDRSGLTSWMPQIETVQRGNEVTVRADLPGLEKDDITIELRDNALVIEGERSNEQDTQEEGYYSSERTYGRFFRLVPLPEGAIADSAKATFKNGVLEVVIQAPPQETAHGRRIEISEGTNKS